MGRILYISVGDLRPLAAAAQTAGVSVSDVFARIGWNRDLLGAPDATLIELSEFFRFLQEVLRDARDETLNVSRRPLMPGTAYFVLSHLIGKRTLLDAMKEIASAYNLLQGGNYNHIELLPDRLSYVIDDRDFPYTSRTNPESQHFIAECVLIFLHTILVLISSEAVHANLLKLRLTREREPHQRGHLGFWGVPIRYGSQKYALVYHPIVAQLPISITTETLPPRHVVFQKIARMIENPKVSFTSKPRVANQVAQLLEQNTFSQAEVASRLGFSTASLRRRLDDEGTSFRALCLAAQNSQAQSLLYLGFSVHEIAERLGFSDFHSFARAFKKWNGQTPAAYLLSRKQ